MDVVDDDTPIITLNGSKCQRIVFSTVRTNDDGRGKLGVGHHHHVSHLGTNIDFRRNRTAVGCTYGHARIGLAYVHDRRVELFLLTERVGYHATGQHETHGNSLGAGHLGGGRGRIHGDGRGTGTPDGRTVVDRARAISSDGLCH